MFKLDVRETGETFYSGPTERNSDGVAHASVMQLADGTLLIGFEDLTGGGDNDFNDVIIGLTGDLEVR